MPERLMGGLSPVMNSAEEIYKGTPHHTTRSGAIESSIAWSGKTVTGSFRLTKLMSTVGAKNCTNGGIAFAEPPVASV
jgi:hypothetical protein